MRKNLGETLKTDKIQWVKTRSPVTVEAGTSLQEGGAQMQHNKRGCAVIVSQGKVQGIFTERDLLTRVITRGIDMKTPVKEVMTADPTLIRLTNSVAEVIQLMSKKGYRNLPLVDGSGHLQGLVTVRDLLDYLAEHFPYEVYNLPPDPHQINRAREGA